MGLEKLIPDTECDFKMFLLNKSMLFTVVEKHKAPMVLDKPKPPTIDSGGDRYCEAECSGPESTTIKPEGPNPVYDKDEIGTCIPDYITGPLPIPVVTPFKFGSKNLLDRMVLYPNILSSSYIWGTIIYNKPGGPS